MARLTEKKEANLSVSSSAVHRQTIIRTTKLVNDLNDEENPFGKLYVKIKEKGMVNYVCHGCAAQTGALEGALDQGLPLCKDMTGHPIPAKYLEQGDEIITF